MGITLREKSSKKGLFSSFRKAVWVLLTLLLVGNVHAQNEITLSIDPNHAGSVTPSTLIDGGMVEVTLAQYQCQAGNLTIKVNGVDYPVVPFGNVDFSTSNGFTLSSTSGGTGVLNINSPGDFCDWQTTGFTFTVYLDFSGEEVYYSAESSFPPKISVDQPALNPFRTCPDRASEAQAFIVSGRDLTDNIDVNPLEGYEYSIDNTDYFPTLSLEPVDGRVLQTVYVRLIEGNEDGTTPAGNIECATSGTESKLIAVSGTVEDIEGIRLSETSLTGFLYREGNAPSDAKSFEVLACSATEITVNAPENFEVSKEGEASGFGNSVTLSSVGGTVWVRMNAVNRGFYTGNVSVTDGVVSENVSVSGTVEMYDCVNHPYDVYDPKDVQVSICALDECDAIFELNIETTNQYYADFGIKKKGETENIKLSAPEGLPNGVRLDYGTNRDAKLVFEGGSHFRGVLYADMRSTGKVIITSQRPSLDERIVVIKGETSVYKCDRTELTAYACPPDLVVDYRWYKNNELVTGENQATLVLEKVMEDAFYSVEVLDADGNVLGSAKIIVSLIGINDLPVPTITSTATGFIGLNELEHQVNEGDSFSFNVTLPEGTSFDNYILQGRSLDVDSFWVDLKTVEAQEGNVVVELTAIDGMLYRLKAFDDDECSADHFSNEILVRVNLVECRGEGELIYYDNFGYFVDENIYAQKIKDRNEYIEHVDYMTILGINNPIEKYWAPDPDSSVVNHTYAMFDTNNYEFCGSAPQKSTGGFYRVEDGYYAILPTPGNGFGDCGEGVYWGDIQDHTLYVDGGYPDDIKQFIESDEEMHKGAMLFINVADLPGLPIYERIIPVECDGINVAFSAFINNAVKEITSNHPVNVRLDIFKETAQGDSLVKSVSSGDIKRRVQANMTEEQNFGWVRLMSKFMAEKGVYKFQLVNNAPSGTGNDLLFDDISITLCKPVVRLIVEGSENLSDTASFYSCSNDAKVKLCAESAYMENGTLVTTDLENYIPTPHYAFLYRTYKLVNGEEVFDGEGIVKVDGDSIFAGKCVEIDLTIKSITKVDVLVASTPQIINEVIESFRNPELDSLPERDCQKFYLKASLPLNFFPYEPDSITAIVCPEEHIKSPADSAFVDDIKWWTLYNMDNGKVEVIKGDADGLSGTNEEKSEIVLEDLKTKYQEYLSDPANVPWDGVEREFYLTFGTFSDCIYDGADGNQDGVSIKLTVLPRITKENITATIDSKPVSDLVQICSDASETIKVAGKIDGTTSQPYTWTWILKETGAVLLDKDAVGLYELKKEGAIPNEGTLIVMTDLQCSDSLEIPFKFYDPFEVELEFSSNIIENELCLSSGSGEEVILTAKLTPADREPKPVYHWYKNGIAMAGNPTTENTITETITEKGKYEYSVVAVDNICFTSATETTGNNADDNYFEAYEPIRITNIKSSSLRNDSVCVGDELTFTATIANPRKGITYGWTSTHEGSPKTGSFDATEETTEITFTIGNVLDDGEVELTIEDQLCGNVSDSKKYYTFILVQETKEFALNQIEPVCLDENGKATKVISLEKPVDGAIKYEWYRKGTDADVKLGEGTSTSYTVELVSGKNTFYAIAVGECDRLTSNEMTIQANELFKVDFKAFLSGDEIGDKGYLCLEGSEGEAVDKTVTLTATLQTPKDGAARTYYWYRWQNGAAPVKINETTSDTNTSSITDNITDNGNYKYMVEVADGVCYTPEGSGIDVSKYDNADTTTFKAREPLSVDFTLSSLYCEDGRTEAIEAIVKGYSDPNDLKAIIYTWEVNGTEVQSGASAKFDLPVKDGDKVKVSINDVICGKDRFSAEKTVVARVPLTLNLSADIIGIKDTCALDSPRVCFSINPSVAQDWAYNWEILDEESVVIMDDETTSRQNCMKMPLGRSGIVRVFAYDQLCDANSEYATMPYNIRDNISIELRVKDMEGNLIPDGAICRDSVILEAAVLAGGTTGGYVWTWFDGQEDTVQLNQPQQRKVELTPELFKYTVNATKEGECADADEKNIATNLIPTEIDIIGRDRLAFCSTEEPLELKAIIEDDRITDYSNINFEWFEVSGSTSTKLGEGLSISYRLPYDFTFSKDIDIKMTATYKDRGDNTCESPNTTIRPLRIQKPLEIAMQNKGDEYNICLDEPYREVPVTVDILAGRPDSVFWYKNGLLDTVTAVDGMNSVTRIVRVASSENFTVLVKDEVCGDVKDEGGVYISVTNKPEFELVINPDVIEITQNTQLTAVINGGEDTTDKPHYWSNDIGWEKETPDNHVITDYMAQEGVYTFHVTTKFGNCSLTTDADLEVLELLNNIITPYNRNGMNDVFMGPKDRRPGYKMEIFNRYQQRIFEGDNGWDGTYRGQLVEPGTYYYRIVMQSGKVMRGTVEVAKF